MTSVAALQRQEIKQMIEPPPLRLTERPKPWTPAPPFKATRVRKIGEAHGRITCEAILNIVAQESRVAVVALRANRRGRSVSRPRQVAMHLMREHCPERSFPEIGRAFNRGHHTVLHACKRMKVMLDRESDEFDDDLYDLYQRCERQIRRLR